MKSKFKIEIRGQETEDRRLKTSESKQMKGGAGFFILGFVMILIVVILILVGLVIKSEIWKVKLNIEFDVKTDDRGTWTLSFLKAEKSGTTYMENIGNSMAEDYSEKAIAERGIMENSLNKTVKSDGVKRSIVVSGKLTLGASDMPDKFFIDIPVPGGGRSVIEVRG